MVAVTFRDQELIMIVPAALYVLLLRGRRLVRLAALAGSFLVPVVGYLGWFAAAHGQFNFTTFDGAFLYGRVADFADCQGLNLPEDPWIADRSAQVETLSSVVRVLCCSVRRGFLMASEQRRIGVFLTRCSSSSQKPQLKGDTISLKKAAYSRPREFPPASTWR